MRVMRYGTAALLVEPEDAAAVLPLADAAAADPDVLEVVPAARTVLVRTAPEATDRLAARLTELTPDTSSPAAEAADELVLDVHYDGPDLAEVAAELGLTVDDVIERHTTGAYVVAFCGFAPGFAYLRGLDEAMHIARRPDPRTRVPAGSVGIAGEFTGVYPRESPGGWRLLGRTDARLWDLDRTPPALLTPGTRVRFRRQ